jgi:hypothetical protein
MNHLLDWITNNLIAAIAWISLLVVFCGVLLGIGIWLLSLKKKPPDLPTDRGIRRRLRYYDGSQRILPNGSIDHRTSTSWQANAAMRRGRPRI